MSSAGGKAKSTAAVRGVLIHWATAPTVRPAPARRCYPHPFKKRHRIVQSIAGKSKHRQEGVGVADQPWRPVVTLCLCSPATSWSD